MPKYFAVNIAVLLLMVIPSWSSTIYSREEAIKIALEKSSSIQEAEQSLKSATAQVDQAYGNAYPSIDLSVQYARTFGVSDVEESASISEMLDASADMNDRIIAGTLDGMMYGLNAMKGFRWGTQVGLSANQVLYAQGKVTTGTKIAKAYKRLSEVTLDQEKMQIRFDVEKAFDQVIYLDSAVAIYEASIEQAKKHLDFVNQSFESGLVGELDRVRAELQVDELSSGLESTKKKQLLAKNALLNTMGLSWTSDVSFKGDLRDPSSYNGALPDTSMAGIRKRRKELILLDASEEMRELNVKIEEGGYKPMVILGGSISYAHGGNRWNDWKAPNWDDNISKKVYLSVTMNLFNGMQTRENITMAKTDLRKAQIQKESAERGIRLEVESAVSSWEDAQKQILIRTRQVDLAKRNLELTEAAYGVGKSPQLDLLDANLSLRNAKLDYMSAVVDWNTAYNALLKATGEY